MILSFEKATEMVLSGLAKEAKEGRKSFNLEFDSLCRTCCHNKDCVMIGYGICRCNHYSKGE